MLLDAVIVAAVGLFVRRGMRRGVISSAFGLAGFAAAAAAAVFGYHLVAAPLARATGMSPGASDSAAALGIFVAASILAWAAVRRLRALVRLTKWGVVDSAAGGALAGAWALSWVSVALLALSVAPGPASLKSEAEHSALARGIVETAPRVLTAIAGADVRHLITSVTGAGFR
ncbi:MAG: CvpA family protein [Actinomycetota bacterium]